MTDKSPYKQLAPKPLWSAAVEQLRGLIDSGEIPVGSRLPAERQLCEQLGISRVSLRESLRVLQSTGYVETRAGSGTYARLPEALETNGDWLHQDLHVAELFELRMIVEPGVAELASVRHTAEDIDAMKATIEEMKSVELSGDRLAAVAADAEFHRLIGQSACNAAMNRLMEQMQELTGPERRVSLGVPGQIARAVEGHQKILDAITAGDGNAAKLAMSDHLEQAVQIMTEYSNLLHLNGQETKKNQ